MLAADVELVDSGQSLRIKGSDESETVFVSTNSAGNVVVLDDFGATILDSGNGRLINLTINLDGGDDLLVIAGSGNNAAEVTGRTIIKLGSETWRRLSETPASLGSRFLRIG